MIVIAVYYSLSFPCSKSFPKLEFRNYNLLTTLFVLLALNKILPKVVSSGLPRAPAKHSDGQLSDNIYGFKWNNVAKRSTLCCKTLHLILNKTVDSILIRKIRITENLYTATLYAVLFSTEWCVSLLVTFKLLCSVLITVKSEHKNCLFGTVFQITELVTLGQCFNQVGISQLISFDSIF